MTAHKQLDDDDDYGRILIPHAAGEALHSEIFFWVELYPIRLITGQLTCLKESASNLISLNGNCKTGPCFYFLARAAASVSHLIPELDLNECRSQLNRQSMEQNHKITSSWGEENKFGPVLDFPSLFRCFQWCLTCLWHVFLSLLGHARTIGGHCPEDLKAPREDRPYRPDCDYIISLHA